MCHRLYILIAVPVLYRVVGDQLPRRWVPGKNKTTETAGVGNRGFGDLDIILGIINSIAHQWKNSNYSVGCGYLSLCVHRYIDIASCRKRESFISYLLLRELQLLSTSDGSWNGCRRAAPFYFGRGLHFTSNKDWHNNKWWDFTILFVHPAIDCFDEVCINNLRDSLLSVL